MILDGGMGTMIQSYKLTEEQFRGRPLLVRFVLSLIVFLWYIPVSPCMLSLAIQLTYTEFTETILTL